MEMSNVLTFAFPRSAGEIPGIYVIKAKRQCNENITNCKGKWRRFYQLAVPPVWSLFLAGFCWTESQSPRYSSGLGAVVTNDWCSISFVWFAPQNRPNIPHIEKSIGWSLDYFEEYI